MFMMLQNLYLRRELLCSSWEMSRSDIFLSSEWKWDYFDFRLRDWK